MMMAGYLEDDKGNKSSMRVMCAASLLAAVVFSWVVITSAQPDPDGLKIVFAFLLCAFAPKAVQKSLEGKT